MQGKLKKKTQQDEEMLDFLAGTDSRGGDAVGSEQTNIVDHIQIIVSLSHQ